jgi:hypothetical protein
MTTLSITQIAAVIANLTGAEAVRYATKEKAAAKLQAALSEVVGNEAAPVLAQSILSSDAEKAAAIVASLKAAPEPTEDEAQAAAEAESAAARDARILEAAATVRSPGLARLRAHPKAEAIRQQTEQEAAAVISGVYPFEKARASRKAALAVIEAETPAPEKVAKPKKERPAKVKAEKQEGRAARVSSSDAEVITAVVANPKKPGSRAHARFAIYSAGQTIAAFVEACVKAGYPEREARADISWDRRKGFISIGAEAAAAA